MTKEIIQNKLLEVKKDIERINDYLSEVEAMENELSDLTLEESELELELAKIEEQEDIDNATAKLHEEHDDYNDDYQLGN